MKSTADTQEIQRIVSENYNKGRYFLFVDLKNCFEKDNTILK